ncbi:type II toxin-antitoxin system VapC family toxin [Lentzea sp. NPDC102401]|uniref:type II toxin-antitoxin system VapC family toxin n=1 Tax=Lentzea sp. NPDC102401 TaxID=3364128 RepID=UPI0037F3ED15
MAELSCLLDTCVLIRLERANLGEYVNARPFLSAVTIAELAFGLDIDDPVERFARSERYYAAVQKFEVLPFGVEEAKVYGQMASLVRRAGRSPRPRRMDLQIAATAAVAGLPVLTMNVKDFKDVERLVKVVPIRQV